jgi:hypothetical protein
MTYRIVISSDIKRQLQALPGHVKPIARQRIAGLSANPRPPAARNLLGMLDTIVYILLLATAWYGWWMTMIAILRSRMSAQKLPISTILWALLDPTVTRLTSDVLLVAAPVRLDYNRAAR